MKTRAFKTVAFFTAALSALTFSYFGCTPDQSLALSNQPGAVPDSQATNIPGASPDGLTTSPASASEQDGSSDSPEEGRKADHVNSPGKPTESSFVPGEVIVAYNVNIVRFCPVKAAQKGKKLQDLPHKDSVTETLISLDQIHHDEHFGLKVANGRKLVPWLPWTDSLLEDREETRRYWEVVRSESSGRPDLEPLDPRFHDFSNYYIFNCRVGEEQRVVAALNQNDAVELAKLNRIRNVLPYRRVTTAPVDRNAPSP